MLSLLHVDEDQIVLSISSLQRITKLLSVTNRNRIFRRAALINSLTHISKSQNLTVSITTIHGFTASNSTASSNFPPATSQHRSRSIINDSFHRNTNAVLSSRR